MDANFHYYALKTLCCESGWQHPQASRMASFSQFVDDYDLHLPFRFGSIPPHAQHLAEKQSDGTWIFHPVTTGYNSAADLERLKDELLQKAISVPFHYIPPKPLSDSVTDRSQYRTRPATLSEPSLMQQMLSDARAEYLRQPTDSGLILVGMLLHLFADTYANQNFSGFINWENHALLMRVNDLSQDSEPEIKAEYMPAIYEQIPSLGNVNLNRAPAHSYVELEWCQKFAATDDGYSLQYQRSNVRDSCTAAFHIYNYLRSLRRHPPLSQSDEAWLTLLPKLVNGLCLNTTGLTANAIGQHWHKLFPDIEYSYSPHTMLDAMLAVDKEACTASQLLSKVHSSHLSGVIFQARDEAFFQYNLHAYHIRNTVNGVVQEAVPLSNQ